MKQGYALLSLFQKNKNHQLQVPFLLPSYSLSSPLSHLTPLFPGQKPQETKKQHKKSGLPPSAPLPGSPLPPLVRIKGGGVGEGGRGGNSSNVSSFPGQYACACVHRFIFIIIQSLIFFFFSSFFLSPPQILPPLTQPSKWWKSHRISHCGCFTCISHPKSKTYVCLS